MTDAGLGDYWDDVYSHLPHAGRLLIFNKGMHRLSIRKPGWAAANRVSCRVNGREAIPDWVGNRLIFSGLQGNEEIEVEVQVVTDTTVYTVAGIEHRDCLGPSYNCTFFGSTAVSVDLIDSAGVDLEHAWYPLFRREHMRTPTAPTKSVSGYVHPEKRIRWHAGH